MLSSERIEEIRERILTGDWPFPSDALALLKEIDRLKAHNIALAERVAAQSELLTKAATNPYALAEMQRMQTV